MGFTKDLHTRKGPDGKRVRTAKWGKGKRWLAVWHDEYGRERSCTFTMKDAADAYWQSMETDRVRGEYTDPKAGRELFGEIGRRWLDSRAVDPASKIHYERAGRLRVEPAFWSPPGWQDQARCSTGMAGHADRDIRGEHCLDRLPRALGLP